MGRSRVSRTSHGSSASPGLYFAYGSNLSLVQMAARCPNSRYLGFARLHGYRLQINNRGFANVVPISTNIGTISNERDPFVDGLLYRLTRSDTAALDRDEGVPSAYQKFELVVEFWPAAPHLLGRDVADIAQHRDELGLRTISLNAAMAAAGPSFSNPSSKNPTQFSSTSSFTSSRGDSARALVYLSRNHTDDHLPWDEYIVRMETGLADAVRLGISPTYVQRNVMPLLEMGRGVRRVETTRNRAGARGAGAREREVESSPERRRMQSSYGRATSPGWRRVVMVSPRSRSEGVGGSRSTPGRRNSLLGRVGNSERQERPLQVERVGRVQRRSWHTGW